MGNVFKLIYSGIIFLKEAILIFQATIFYTLAHTAFPRTCHHQKFQEHKFSDTPNTEGKFKACVRYFLSNFYFFIK